MIDTLEQQTQVIQQKHVEVFVIPLTRTICLLGRGHPVYVSAEVQMFNVLMRGSKY